MPPTAQAALAANAAAMRRLIDALRARRRSAELQTQSVSVWPRSAEQGRLDGYVATNTVSSGVTPRTGRAR